MTVIEACESVTNTTPEFPMGWYSVVRSHELGVGDVQVVQAFDREMVVYRTRSGKAALHDAFCPHLGAHMGHEGRVVGESIRCPFHGWQFNAEDGKCSHIPYCDDIPERAAVRNWPVQEKNGEVYVWFHPENTEPQWDLPDLPELNDPNWSEAKYTEHRVPAHVQDICENSCDPVHFQYVHRQKNVPEANVSVDEDGRTMHLHAEMVDADVPGHLHATTFSPGFALVRTTYGPNAEMIMYNSAQPVSRHETFMRWTLLVRKEIEDAVGDDAMRNIISGLSDDYPVWANKVHKHKPVFCRGDDSLVTFRKWVRQFYITPQHKGE